MQIQILIDILETLVSDLRTSRQEASAKQASLISRDRVSIESHTRAEEKLMVKIRINERNRLSYISTVYKTIGIESNNYKLSAFLKNLGPSLSATEVMAIQRLESEIKTEVESLLKVNKQNLFLIENSRKFITEVINGVLSNTRRSILDRKV